jgi:hypothetical protein
MELQNFNIHRAVTTEKIGALGQRNGDARFLRNGRGGSQKWENGNDRGEGEMHLVIAELKENTVELRKEQRGEMKRESFKAAEDGKGF